MSRIEARNYNGRLISFSYESGEFKITRKCDEGYLTIIRTRSKDSDNYGVIAIMEKFPESMDRNGICLNENMPRKKWKRFRNVIFNASDWRINRIFKSLEETINSMELEAILD